MAWSGGGGRGYEAKCKLNNKPKKPLIITRPGDEEPSISGRGDDFSPAGSMEPENDDYIITVISAVISQT